MESENSPPAVQNGNSTSAVEEGERPSITSVSINKANGNNIKEPVQNNTSINSKSINNGNQSTAVPANGISGEANSKSNNVGNAPSNNNGVSPVSNNIQKSELNSGTTAAPNGQNNKEKSSAAESSNAVKPAANGQKNGSEDNEEEEKEKDKLPFFHFTQGKYWEEPNANFTHLKVLSIFPLSGFFGWDHLYLRSPLSAALKTIFNFITFGMWYFYDMAQVLGEPDLVKNAGMSYPVLGSTGLGSGVFKEPKEEKAKGNNNKGQAGGGEDDENSLETPSPVMFLIYTLLVLVPLPFALDYFAVGDISGGIAKVFANFNFFLIIFSIFGFLLTIFRLVFQTERIFSEGIPRFFPFTLIMSDNRCLSGTLGPKRPCKTPEGTGEGFFAFLKRLFGSLKGLPVIGNLVGLVETATDIASQAYNNYGKPLIAAGATAATLAPKVASEVAARVNELGDVNAAINRAKQQGGAREAKEQDNGTSIFIFVGLATVAAAGVFLANIRNLDVIDVTNILPRTALSILRKAWLGNNNFFSSFSRKFNDSPPNPTTV